MGKNGAILSHCRSQDLRDPQTLNPYSYCRNNPLKYTDPSGRFIPLLAIGIGIVLGAGGYTASVAIHNAINDQPLMQGFDPIDCVMWAALGGVSGGILAGASAAGATGGRLLLTALAVNVGETEIGYGISAGRKGEWTWQGALTAGGVAAGFTAVGFGVSSALSKWIPARAPNGGALGRWGNHTLEVDEVISRIGNPGGRYAAPNWVPKWMRSLPPDIWDKPTTIYRVTKPIEVEKSFTMPYYWQLGLGPQYRFKIPIQDLVGHGLEEVK
ncbi:MAG: glycohydrolase toxin TNT-related protein [Dehalococcoidia bacterium]|nr:glycohydrolase toxin TNT-related protein [Dehalococcoidia bacterium]